jgi:hypothetical protein
LVYMPTLVSFCVAPVCLLAAASVSAEYGSSTALCSICRTHSTAARSMHLTSSPPTALQFLSETHLPLTRAVFPHSSHTQGKVVSTQASSLGPDELGQVKPLLGKAASAYR